MVLDYYQLREQPFGVTPDSRYLFLNPTYKEALSSLIYGIESGCGFVALIAPPGMGKTTLLFQAMEILRAKTKTVFLFQTISTPLDLLRALLSGLGVRDMGASLVEMQIRLKEMLSTQFRQGRRVVLVIDEAQNLDDSVLELVRMLSNFETVSDKLIQIILAGQPQLADTIGSPQLLQLRQRVSIFARLKPFTAEEISQYIATRLRIAGYASSMPLFTKDALTLIALWSEGIPRNINNLCFNALSLGCALQQRPIDRDVLRQVIADLDLGPLRKKATLPPTVEDKVPLTSAELSSTENDPSVFAGWLPKAAVGLVALLIAAAALLEGRQWLVRPATAQSNPAVLVLRPKASSAEAPPAVTLPPSDAVAPLSPASAAPPSQEVANTVEPQTYKAPITAPPAASASNTAAPYSPPPVTALSERTPSTADSTGLVRVGPGQTLKGICVEKFGNCTSQLLRQIRDLNPSLNNLDHIEPGQTIRLPVLDAQSNAAEQPRRTASAEKGSHE
jgi:type II secretory pathway predicted ATPase ExeA